MSWPPNSPDLNPIENIWNILKSKVARTKTTTALEFENLIMDKWFTITMETINAVIDSMSSRILKLIENKGDYINY